MAEWSACCTSFRRTQVRGPLAAINKLAMLESPPSGPDCHAAVLAWMPRRVNPDAGFSLTQGSKTSPEGQPEPSKMAPRLPRACATTGRDLPRRQRRLSAPQEKLDEESLVKVPIAMSLEIRTQHPAKPRRTRVYRPQCWTCVGARRKGDLLGPARRERPAPRIAETVLEGRRYFNEPALQFSL